VLRWGEGPKHPKENPDTSAPHRRRNAVSASEN
jgi:hypothetical protein